MKTGTLPICMPAKCAKVRTVDVECAGCSNTSCLLEGPGQPVAAHLLVSLQKRKLGENRIRRSLASGHQPAVALLSDGTGIPSRGKVTPQKAEGLSLETMSAEIFSLFLLVAWLIMHTEMRNTRQDFCKCAQSAGDSLVRYLGIHRGPPSIREY
jgi:hypothetical protein